MILLSKKSAHSPQKNTQMKALKVITKIIPFLAVIVLNVFAIGSGFRLYLVQPIAIIVAVILIANLILAFSIKVNDHFSIGISTIGILGVISIFAMPVLGQLYIENVIAGLYIGLFLVAILPPLFKIKPFTVDISKGAFPEVIVKSDLFRKVNNIMSYVWACLFFVAIILTIIPYSEDSGMQIILSSLIPAIPLLGIGLPATKLLPPWLNQRVSSKRIIFTSLAEASEAMPFGLNKKLSKGIDTVIQFELTGEEPGIVHLIMKEQKCEFFQEPHPNPATVIKSDSKLWLDITNNIVSGDDAFINDLYTVEGDASILLIFGDLFAPVNEVDVAEYEPREMNYNYKNFGPNKIKNIVVLDGGPRNAKYSKTTFMVDNFIEGAKHAGANVETFKLKNYKINHCTGCYTCWTKTPCECIFKDDMTMLRKKYREADMVVFASPLYIFNVTGIMKDFMDRLLPILKPYMLMDKKGYIKHPDRFPEKGEQGFVVFSAAGFPDIDHNFDGLEAMYRMWDSHNENMYLMGEFFMTAAEVIVQTVFSQRNHNIKIVCQKAGEQVVKEGKIDKEFMQLVSFPGVSKKRFQHQAYGFWETLDGKARYLTEVPKIEVVE